MIPWVVLKMLKHKLIYLVLDGVGDRVSDPTTTLEIAEKPGLDLIARNSKCGLMYTVGKGIAPESDEAVISLLGYDPHEVYTGRGPLEALGAGLSIKEGYEIAFRANFATINPSTLKIMDRRVGRSLSSEEARLLAKDLDNMSLEKYEGYARVVATIGHRAVVIIGSKKHKLSPMVENNDPAYSRHGLVSIAVQSFKPYLREITPLDNSEEAKITAELANMFVKKTIEILDRHPVNKARVQRGLPPANVLLIRDAGGRFPEATPLGIKYQSKFTVLAEMPVEIGIGRAFGAETLIMDPPTGDPERDYRIRVEKTLEALRISDIVYVHLKGPDEPGHDGDLELKKNKVEEIDKFYVRPLLDKVFGQVALIVTADHATPPLVRSHTDDPVPVAFYAPGIEPDGVTKFTEKECAKGSIGVLDHGWMLLPMVVEQLKE
ncbi:MAG: 2,3-bisphosphoglycerate-independent phosphoglycerate mutase [Thermosphaera sp.]